MTEPVVISRRLPMAADRGWGFLTSPEVQSRVLGAGSAIPPRAGAAVRLVDSSGVWRAGTVEGVAARSALTARVAPPASWQAAHGTVTSVTVELTEDPKDQAAVVTVTEEGFDGLGGGCDPAAARAEALRYWTGVVDRIAALATQARQRRKGVAQAVVVIHGIGEQVPGSTVRAFVQAVAEPGEREQVRSQPDRISPGFELRSWRLDATADRPTTDFFEGYWAAEVRDTSLGQVLSWLRMLLIRRPSTVAPGLRTVWWGVWVTLALLGGAVAWIWATDTKLTDPTGLLALALPLISGVVTGFMVQSVGDAARYLWPHPANVAVRDRVRGKGVALLEELHRSGRYSRIVVVGHSLGSVIAYDIVAHLWIRMHRRHASPVDVSNQAAVALAAAVEAGGTDAAGGRLLQWAAWKEARRNTQPWLISDMVTMGSPLAHAGTLLAHSPPELEATIRRTELPGCPPSPPDDIWFDGSYENRFGDRRNFRYWRDNAPFAVTRWSNLFFPARAGVFGDLIGGPLDLVFGAWVDDESVAWNAGWWRGHTPLAHTAYWRLPKSSAPEASEHLRKLRDALALGCRKELEQLTETLPVEAWLGPEG